MPHVQDDADNGSAVQVHEMHAIYTMPAVLFHRPDEPFAQIEPLNARIHNTGQFQRVWIWLYQETVWFIVVFVEFD